MLIVGLACALIAGVPDEDATFELGVGLAWSLTTPFLTPSLSPATKLREILTYAVNDLAPAWTAAWVTPLIVPSAVPTVSDLANVKSVATRLPVVPDAGIAAKPPSSVNVTMNSSWS